MILRLDSTLVFTKHFIYIISFTTFPKYFKLVITVSVVQSKWKVREVGTKLKVTLLVSASSWAWTLSNVLSTPLLHQAIWQILVFPRQGNFYHFLLGPPALMDDYCRFLLYLSLPPLFSSDLMQMGFHFLKNNLRLTCS